MICNAHQEYRFRIIKSPLYASIILLFTSQDKFCFCAHVQECSQQHEHIEKKRNKPQKTIPWQTYTEHIIKVISITTKRRIQVIEQDNAQRAGRQRTMAKEQWWLFRNNIFRINIFVNENKRHVCRFCGEVASFVCRCWAFCVCVCARAFYSATLRVRIVFMRIPVAEIVHSFFLF